MSDVINTADQLLTLYNEIDHALRKEYKKNKFADHGFLIQELASTNHVVARHQQVMRTVAQIRNSLIHNPIPAAQPLVAPNPSLIAAYMTIRDALLHPASALSIAVPAQKLYTSTPTTNLNKVIKTMDQHIYTHVPILENNKMIGVFSENALLSYLADNPEVIITKDMTISDLAAYLPLKAHRGECFEFLPRRAPLSQVYEVFNAAIRKRQRIGMLFITEHGKQHEKPLGIITAWDLASPEFDL